MKQKEQWTLLFRQPLAFTVKGVRRRSITKQKSICEANVRWIFARYWNGVNSNQWTGSVTVFFSLIFTLLLSFSLTFYQMAAEAARGSFEYAAAKLAVESFFAAYHYPLYEMYHIFGREIDGVQYGETGEDFMERLVMADLQEMTAAKSGTLSLLRRDGAVVDVQDVTYVTDEAGTVFFNEAVAYMKYESVSSFFRLFEEQQKEAEKVDARLEFMEQKTEVDRAYAELEEEFICLIKYIDGIDLEKYEKYLGGRKIDFLEPYYVKYFCVYEEKEARIYFKREDIFAAYWKHHVNPFDSIEEMQCLLEEWYFSNYKALEKENQIYQITEQIEELLSRIEQEKQEDLKTEEEKEQEEEIKKQLLQLKKEKNELEQDKEEWKEQVRTIRNMLVKKQNSFLKQCRNVLKSCEQTNEILERMNAKLVLAKEKRASLQQVLAKQEVLEEDEIVMWQEELQEYDCYEKEGSYDLEQMKQTIKKNTEILSVLLQKTFTKETDYMTVEQCIQLWREQITAYTFKGLVLEYGNLEAAQMSLAETTQTVSEQLSETILDLLLVKEVSDATLQEESLPSKEYLEYKQETTDLSSLLQFEQIQRLLQLLQSQSGVGMAEVLSSSILFQAYLKEYFNSYLTQTNQENTALQYELEYMLAGEESDLQNLTEVVLQMIMMRMALHFSSILTNVEKRELAEQAAMALAGITGMPALKYVATTVFLFIWSLEEALVDVAALLAGKNLPVYPGPNGGCILFSELLLFTKAMIKNKVECIQNVGGVLTDYTDYLHLLLFIKENAVVCYRAMDLIQSNLRYNGMTDFKMNQCIYGAKLQKNNIIWEFCY